MSPQRRAGARYVGSNLAIGGTVNIGAAPSGLANNLSAHLLFLAVYGADRNTDVEAYITQEWGV